MSVSRIAEFTQAPFAPPAQTATEAEVAQGGIIYRGACSICHCDGGASRGMFPDLRRSPLLQSQEAFDQVVLVGLCADRGMKSFEGQLTAADTTSIRAYMVERATNARDAEAANAPGFWKLDPGNVFEVSVRPLAHASS